ncbi:MAG: Crp/Fnr family transcriptional regulator [Oscillospiraceae bacterium]|nr:Crp/Fnr family transcriptional regulator [Oscillospiraceae bacterium]
MKEPADILLRSPLMSGLPEEFIRRTLLPLGKPRQFPKNGAVISAQEQIDWFGIVLEGRVQIVQMFSTGMSSLMENLLPSYALGIDLIFTKTRTSPYYAMAAEPSQVMAFPRELLTRPGLLPEEARLALWQQLLTMISQANIRKHNRIAILSQRGLRDRVLTYLILQSNRRGGSSFQIPFSREELADYLCVNRSALSHELSLMEREGLIRFRKNQFTILPKGEEQSSWKRLT